MALITSGCAPLQWSLQYELCRTCFTVEEDQLERAKAALKTNLMLSLDDTSQVAEVGRSPCPHRHCSMRIALRCGVGRAVLG